MSDKDKIQAAIDALEALEGLPIAHYMQDALELLNMDLKGIRLPSICIRCRVTEDIDGIFNTVGGFGHCYPCLVATRKVQPREW